MKSPEASRSATAVEPLLRDGMPVQFTAYDGSAAGPATPPKELSSSTGAAWPTC